MCVSLSFGKTLTMQNKEESVNSLNFFSLMRNVCGKMGECEWSQTTSINIFLDFSRFGVNVLLFG